MAQTLPANAPGSNTSAKGALVAAPTRDVESDAPFEAGRLSISTAVRGIGRTVLRLGRSWFGDVLDREILMLDDRLLRDIGYDPEEVREVRRLASLGRPSLMVPFGVFMALDETLQRRAVEDAVREPGLFVLGGRARPGADPPSPRCTGGASTAAPRCTTA